MQAGDESQITEIELLPDGRICLFGASMPILQVLEDLGLGDAGLRVRLGQAGQAALPALASPVAIERSPGELPA